MSSSKQSTSVYHQYLNDNSKNSPCLSPLEYHLCSPQQSIINKNRFWTMHNFQQENFLDWTQKWQIILFHFPLKQMKLDEVYICTLLHGQIKWICNLCLLLYQVKNHNTKCSGFVLSRKGELLWLSEFCSYIALGICQKKGWDDWKLGP